MLGFLSIIVILLAGIYVVNKKPAVNRSREIKSKFSSQLDKLWRIQQDAIRGKKYLRAEKALLMILRVDERNAVAYNRLGMIFAKQGDYDDAIECFEIAQSLAPSASSFHNVGLVHMEIGDFEKAAIAMEQAMRLEENVAFRHISYAQVLEKLGNKKAMIDELEKAVDLEPTPQVLRILAQAYDEDDRKQLAASLRNRASKLTRSRTTHRNIQQPRKMAI
ncbi:MAG: tetratricopeptide repeat protein [Candidatus Nomurabacteria bacterium]|jgi:superkiller protein 3|nr:tetratricopeptide repeat protein [Candidatus Nomurabacteria bacterium]